MSLAPPFFPVKFNTGIYTWAIQNIPNVNFLPITVLGTAYQEVGYGEEGYGQGGYDTPSSSAPPTSTPVWNIGSRR